MARSYDLTSGSIPQHLLRLAAPLIMGNILQQLYNTVDAFILGRFAGDLEFAAVDVAGSVMNLFLFMITGACTGISVIFAQLYGAGERERFRREHWLSLSCGLLVTLACSGLGFLLLSPLLRLIQTPSELKTFAAQTTAEFWRRWHISLSSWVRDYLFLPLSSFTRRWGQWGMAASLMVTFIALGIWHGAGWTFAVYGLIQGLVIVWELRTERIRNKVKGYIGKPLFATLSVIRTYLIFAVSLVFFKAQSISDAFYFLRNISFQSHVSWKEINIGMSDHICIVTGATLLLILLYDFFMSRGDLHLRFEKQPALFRWTVYYLIVFAVFAYGKFGTEDFIYLQF